MLVIAGGEIGFSFIYTVFFPTPNMAGMVGWCCPEAETMCLAGN